MLWIVNEWRLSIDQDVSEIRGGDFEQGESDERRESDRIGDQMISKENERAGENNE